MKSKGDEAILCPKAAARWMDSDIAAEAGARSNRNSNAARLLIKCLSLPCERRMLAVRLVLCTSTVWELLVVPVKSSFDSKSSLVLLDVNYLGSNR